MMHGRQRMLGWGFILLPLAILAADLTLFPLLESRAAARPVSVEALVRERRQALGTVRLHRLDVALDTLDAPAFGAEVRDRTSALVIPCFSNEDEVTIGELGKYAEERLHAVSSADAARLDELLQSQPVAKGTVRDLALHVPPQRRAAFPFDHLFIVALAQASDRRTGGEGVFGSAVPRLLQLAAADHVATLVVPAVGYNWANKHSISFDSLYQPLLNGLTNGGDPKVIVLDLYRRWPTFSIQDAVRSANGAMSDFLVANPPSRLYRQDIRLLLLLVSVCLFATSRFVPLSTKVFLVVSAAYITLCLGAGAFVDAVSAGVSGVGRTVIQVLLFATLACAFPIVARWKADQIFPPEGRS